MPGDVLDTLPLAPFFSYPTEKRLHNPNSTDEERGFTEMATGSLDSHLAVAKQEARATRTALASERSEGNGLSARCSRGTALAAVCSFLNTGRSYPHLG